MKEACKTLKMKFRRIDRNTRITYKNRMKNQNRQNKTIPKICMAQNNVTTIFKKGSRENHIN